VEVLKPNIRRIGSKYVKIINLEDSSLLECDIVPTAKYLTIIEELASSICSVQAVQDNGGSKVFRNVGNCLPVYSASRAIHVTVCQYTVPHMPDM
jgi:hypothetical protein